MKDKVKEKVKDIPSFEKFMANSKLDEISEDPLEGLDLSKYEEYTAPGSKYFIETYG